MMDCSRVKWETIWDIAHFGNAHGFEFFTAVDPDTVQFADAVFGLWDVSCAVLIVWADIRFQAVLTGRDVWRGVSGKHGVHLGYIGPNAFEQRIRLVEHRMEPEQGVYVESNPVIDVIAVEREHARIPHIKSGCLAAPIAAPLHREYVRGLQRVVDLTSIIRQPSSGIRWSTSMRVRTPSCRNAGSKSAGTLPDSTKRRVSASAAGMLR